MLVRKIKHIQINKKKGKIIIRKIDIRFPFNGFTYKLWKFAFFIFYFVDKSYETKDKHIKETSHK